MHAAHPEFSAPLNQPDHHALSSGVWIAHEDPLGPDGEPTGERGGALTNVVLRGASGPIALVPGERPRLRDLELVLERSIGEGPDGLSGVPLDLAFDDQLNLGALRGYHTAFSAGEPAIVNGKGLVREVPGVGILSTNAPSFVFVPTRGGMVDVIDLASGLRFDVSSFHAGTQSIPAPGVVRAMDYFRQ